ncbi:MAG: hypothetical protein ACYC2J_11375 [Acidithiobacillus ferrooxidans]|jgi:hypothetical protein|uniref:Uncharacterized protein n=1 Tax=mine drainage metagenome TaxID=410659 RepID=E6QA07_9ZZZZ
MDVKEVVESAKHYIMDIYQEEKITNVGLEEVDFDEKNNVWFVTIGFSRPWDEPRNPLAALAGQGAYVKRTFKTVRVLDKDGKIRSIKNRESAT